MDISVYTITHRFNQRFYLGYSQQTWKRFRNHVNMLRRGDHHCIHLQRAWAMYGEDAFDFRRLEVFESVAAAIESEQMYFDAFFAEGKLYNSIGTNDPKIVIRRAHTSASITASADARRNSQAFKDATARNRKLANTPEAQAKRIATTRARNSWNPKRMPVQAINELTGETFNFQSLCEAAKFVGAGSGNVFGCCNGLRNRVKGFLLHYAEVPA